MVRSIKKRDVLAVGGVYDHLLLNFRPLGKVPDREQHGVGVSISFDKVITDHLFVGITKYYYLCDSLI